VFRNEITKGKFVFRTLEFEQMELQYFIKEASWEKTFREWRRDIEKWYTYTLGIDKSSFQWKPHNQDKLAHYAKKAEDYEYKFSWGFDEVAGLHYRTDFDLSTHEKHSGQKLGVLDTETGSLYIPHVIESTFGIGRVLLMLMDAAYTKEESRVVMKFSPNMAPYKAAVFPLLANKTDLVEKADKIFKGLIKKFSVVWDDRGNIGKRYLSQDEIGTPFCITVDFNSLQDDTVTVRDRDSTKQERVSVDKLSEYLQTKIV
jgi:glycyl-tRNA synthetase